MEINQNTVIDNGLQLSRRFLLEHFSSGAYHSDIGRIIPQFTAKLQPSKYNNLYTSGPIPLWKVARSLQVTSSSIAENLLREFGSDLIIRSGFLNSIPKNTGIGEVLHTVGRSIDIQINGFSDNIFPIAKDLQKICSKASSIQFAYGTSSWVHINVDIKKAVSNVIREELPLVSTVDTIANVVESGITSIRGIF